MNLKTVFLPPDSPLPPGIILPEQTHSAKIQEILTGQEDLSQTDGIWTQNPDLVLGIKTADCASIAWENENQWGLLHVGWRGFCQDIIEKMNARFKNSPPPHVHVFPFLHVFEIQKDFCYEALSKKCGHSFFQETSDKIFFDFYSALRFFLPPQTTFDPRSTDKDIRFASWRRNRTPQRNFTLMGSEKNLSFLSSSI